jgi:hypothetical protein
MKQVIQFNKTFFIVYSGKECIFAYNSLMFDKVIISNFDFLKITFIISSGEM